MEYKLLLVYLRSNSPKYNFYEYLFFNRLRLLIPTQMKNTVRYIVAVLLILVGPSSFAKEEKRPFTATLYGGVYLNNEQAWTIEPSVAWHFHKYIGVGLGIELTSQYNQPSRTTTINGHEASLADNEKDVAWIIFKPSDYMRLEKATHTFMR